jgi:hypothetical protein
VRQTGKCTSNWLPLHRLISADFRVSTSYFLRATAPHACDTQCHLPNALLLGFAEVTKPTNFPHLLLNLLVTESRGPDLTTQCFEEGLSRSEGIDSPGLYR